MDTFYARGPTAGRAGSTCLPYIALRSGCLRRMERNEAPDGIRMGSRKRQVRLGQTLEMDHPRLPAVSRIQKSLRGSRRVQREIYDQSDGLARSVDRHAGGPQSSDI